MSGPSHLISIASGAYSDYQNAPFRVLKPFTLRGVWAEYLAQYKGSKWAVEEGFIGWMSQNGYIEDLDMPEVNLDYDMSGPTVADDLRDHQFAPLEKA